MEMKFLCLCYYDAKRFAARSPAEQKAIGRECQPHDEALHKSGRLIAVGSLALPEESACLRPVGDQATRTEGPFVATHEPLGAFFLIEAKDLDEAMQVASLHPGAALCKYFGGGIEVRPVRFFEQL
jgi:hypothetical protein